MGHQRNVIPEAELVYGSLYADVTHRDLIDFVNELRSDPSFQPQFREFVDLSGVRSFDVTSSQLADIGRRANQLFAPESRRVAFAPTDLAFGISRMFQVFSEQAGGKFSVVRTREAACAFLGIEEGKIPVSAAQ